MKEGTRSEGEPDAQYAVEFRHADLRYKSASENSLTNIDFTVKHGEVIGIIGGTGCGKRPEADGTRLKKSTMIKPVSIIRSAAFMLIPS